ncbi:hypothetical protein L211DRAFT_847372 [Terfezia boudieri ATCC MYA-4762]|uniref:BTB domain-containing protein n=1 Tax=Terfezia boudieri ATCC MYA-4762 TaxID=1051890 RepID=A0A3N4LTF5_9PEZI|nr:hypothetical protein L211DRAFT_847372 [Terfezia boudieri ATCC MYA-4762]
MPTVQFDPDGFVILVIPSKVNSHSLFLASSVFHAMFGANAPFKEGNSLRNRDAGSLPIEIKLGDDDPKALAILLRLVHFQLNLVPRTLSGDQLYQLVIICDKYDLRQILGWPCLDQWIPMGTQVGGEIAGDQWLFVAYVFG